jgi:hypothetical protein
MTLRQKTPKVNGASAFAVRDAWLATATRKFVWRAPQVFLKATVCANGAISEYQQFCKYLISDVFLIERMMQLIAYPTQRAFRDVEELSELRRREAIETLRDIMLR